MTVRQPAVAGSFYPEDPRQLAGDVRKLLSKAPLAALRPKALIAPHAGFVYSGPIAATAYKCLEPVAAGIDRVILLGPAHRVALQGVALPGCGYFKTPLGDVALDPAAIAALADFDQVSCDPGAHRYEHSLEVQLPFLQIVLGDFQLVPLVVGHCPPPAVAEVLERLWGGDETLIVVSSDLSHYHPYATAQQLDRTTTAMIEALSDQLQSEQACGCMPLNGLLYLAKHHHLQLSTLDLRNSGDTAGSREQVVGYGAYALH
ncbi:AmmeMemoRadiSam system protein B [Exilibacterium tricleocarpae]|uniref:MEMO1 family protein FKG94_10800 n=1 Tax=Exilibacterium tricleocarpae TaxID=2591008 RepID=A0A545TSE6_9GAMM|nr:AmmeMemoRadiSam system protein B [Exilibacterium tricleocarpae]TQV80148.1 AmmeMemoRadiSam system protein B [Exilibacterium tricleocarpae]